MRPGWVMPTAWGGMRHVVMTTFQWLCVIHMLCVYFYIYVIECDPHMCHVYLQVKELYQGVLEKVQLLQPFLITEEKMGEDYERMRREVEREVVRRKTLGSQLRTLLDTQLQVYMLFLSEYLLLSRSKNVKLSLFL